MGVVACRFEGMKHSRGVIGSEGLIEWLEWERVFQKDGGRL